MEVKVYGSDGSATGRSVALDPSVFEMEPNDHAIWLDVRRIQANSRQGTHKAKERSEVRGSTRKLYRQKGTGFARAGDAKSPVRRSGGTIFGPRPRSYGFKVNRKTSLLARRSALSYKASDGAIRVVEDFVLSDIRTKDVVAFLAALDLSDSKVLLLTNEHRPEVHRSSRNVRKVKVTEARKVSTLDVLGADVLVVEETALETIGNLLGRSEPSPA